ISGYIRGTIHNCYSAGIAHTYVDKPYKEYDYTTKICGYQYNSSDIYNCYSLGYGDLNGLTIEQMKSKDSFTGFDFENTWYFDKNSEYMFPKLKNAPDQYVCKKHEYSYSELIKKATCEEAGEKVSICDDCGSLKEEEVPASHNWDSIYTVDKEATCTEKGTKSIHCSVCDATKDKTEIDKKAHTEGEPILTEATFFKEGSIVTKCRICNTVMSIEPLYYESNRIRYAGANRYDTALSIADGLKASLGVDKFKAIVVATGDDYPDALAGGYLAHVKNAPIIMVAKNGTQDETVREYIRANVVEGGAVYLLGGKGVVSEGFANSLKSDYNVVRCGGADRYETNIAIIKEAGVMYEDLMICTGNGYADSLAASGVNKPILLVEYGGLRDDQKKYLQTIYTGNMYAIGGDSVVSKAVFNELKGYCGSIERVAGSDRYKTSVEVAKKFFSGKTDTIVLAYGLEYPDGISGGPLAISLGAPMILATGNEDGINPAVEFVRMAGITNVVTLGADHESRITEKTVTKIIAH
ncbi:MAG: cell wall-binding repeat-containing protein, partial [Lachnospiraceae bacterium]|nr:cell wall-binding repeat-containing protein [Lachnospiraceae bacterium]